MTADSSDEDIPGAEAPADSGALAVPDGITDLDGYRKWLQEDPVISLDQEYETFYDDVLTVALERIKSSSFWLALPSALSTADGQFRLNLGSHLMDRPKDPPKLDKKPYASFIEKTYRKNVLRPDYPRPPVGGWLLPDDWLEKVRDLIRTTVVVRYLDGVEVLAKSLTALADEHAIQSKVDFEAREEGYYAAHFTAEFDCEIPSLVFDTESLTICLEIHIATQIQGVLRELLHPRYEQRRLERPSEADRRWQWNFDSPEFALNYLGHISHYVDGMIVGLRDDARKSRPKDEGRRE
ncbi:MAG: hypothetical protein KJ698_05070 [Actinobacteria bacterium]|nr:hypothetical protein [Actinomycetota bacterium]MBU1494571.1 hypothetical protein [Actinomycetota bacterium]MBU1864879.1 hypothetical protein [Actinomycetota bacterium]